MQFNKSNASISPWIFYLRPIYGQMIRCNIRTSSTTLFAENKHSRKEGKIRKLLVFEQMYKYNHKYR